MPLAIENPFADWTGRSGAAFAISLKDWRGMKIPRQVGAPLIGTRYCDLWRYRVRDYRIVAEINPGDVRNLVVWIAYRRYI